MSIIKNTALEYLRLGLSIVPAKEDKRPALDSWESLQKNPLTEEELADIFSFKSIRPEIEREIPRKDKTSFTVKGIKLYPKEEPKKIGIICGAVSGGLEVIDVDTKHDTTGTLWNDLWKLIEDNLPDLCNDLVIAQTISGGYHIYYRCSTIAGNLKLALKENKEVLIETRGEGGYVVAPPSTGYTYIQLDPSKIPTITPEERDLLFNIAKDFSEIEEVKPKVPTPSSTTYNSTGLTPFEDYNQRGDIVGLLESKGWREVGHQRGQRVNLLRPGQTDSKTSGNFHTGLRTLRVFSSSTEFATDKAYSPSQVFSLLECNEDNKITYRRLLEMGYGEPYKGEEVRTTTQVKTDRIKVEVTTLEGSTVIADKGGFLKIEDIQTATGKEATIYTTGAEDKVEVLKAIALLQQAEKRIYIVEGDNEIREYTYQQREIFNKYGTIQEQNGKLTPREKDSLLDEVVIVSTNLQPIDRDIYLKQFIDNEAVKELGITEESLTLTVDRLTSSREKEEQKAELKELLSEAKKHQEKGDVSKALELLDNKVKEVKLKDKGTEFSKLLKATTESEIRERQANKPESLNSGYNIGGEPLLLPSGAISILTAPTSHGKTTFLINLALNIAKEYTDKEVYLFSYEEDGDAILINAFNAYLDHALSAKNRRALQSYFTTGSTEYIKDSSIEYFKSEKDKFFRELIESKRLNINYSNYDSDTLIEAIRYLHKNTKVGAVFIDYIQLLRLPEGKYKTYSRQEEIKEICIALKDVSVETGLPIILGAQFNRTVANPLHLHPTKIGEAGDIERIANLIVGFWNNNHKVNASEGEQKEIKEKQIDVPDTLYTEILKQRGGRVGLYELLDFNGNEGTIKNNRLYHNTTTPTSNYLK
jgi:replicative DNA helicase